MADEIRLAQDLRLRCAECKSEPCICLNGREELDGVDKADPWIGTVLDGRYEILALIDTGGMSRVYKARHTSLGVVRAVKVIYRETAIGERSLKRFEKEARMIGNLSHPNLVACVDYGTAPGGRPYVVMEFLEGRTISQLLKGGVIFDEARAVKIFVQVCKGLHYVHEASILHRDIKPGNLMLINGANNEELLKVLDFGIAKIQDTTEIQKLTRTGEICGSPVYMSPEQAKGLSVDERSDVYSFGCVMYEMLSGNPPLMGENAIETIMMHLNEKPAVICTPSKKRIAPGLEAVVMRCLEKEPHKRYKNLNELQHDLELLAGGDALMRLQVERALRAQRWKRIHTVCLVALMVTYGGVKFLDFTTGSESWRLDVERSHSFYYDLDAAERYLQHALNKLPDNDVIDRNRAAIFMCWARLYDTRGDLQDAEKYFEHAEKYLQLYVKRSGGRGELTWLPLMADVSDGLARCYRKSQRLSDAETQAVRAVSSRRKVLSLDQPTNRMTNQRELANSLEWLGAIELDFGKYKEALAALDESELILRSISKDLLHLSSTLELKGRVWLKCGNQVEKARNCLTEALKIRSRETHTDVTHSRITELEETLAALESKNQGSLKKSPEAVPGSNQKK